MRDSYIENLRKLTGEEKGQINAVYRAALDAAQQSYYEDLTIKTKSGKEFRKFDIFEGTVLQYDPGKGYGYFIPNKHLKELLDNSEAKATSNFLSKKMGRFASILQEAYRDFYVEKATDNETSAAKKKTEKATDGENRDEPSGDES